jgi:dihydropteroate synthase
LDAGADIVNDVSACRDSGWLDVLRDRDVPIVLMHMRGSPRDMQVDPEYPGGVVTEVVEFLARRIRGLEESGIDPSRLLVDPGIGFGKQLNDNWDLVRNIEAFRALDRPVFIGASRKSFLRRTLEPALAAGGMEELLDLATTAVNAMALIGGADVLRVHNVAYARVLVRLYGAFAGLVPGT